MTGAGGGGSAFLTAGGSAGGAGGAGGGSIFFAGGGAGGCTGSFFARSASASFSRSTVGRGARASRFFSACSIRAMHYFFRSVLKSWRYSGRLGRLVAGGV